MADNNIAVRMIDLAEVPKAELMRFAGEPWESVVAHDGDGLTMRQIEYGYVWKQDARSTWTPPLNRAGEPMAFLPLEHAWLRKHDNRAFLYLQNW